MPGESVFTLAERLVLGESHLCPERAPCDWRGQREPDEGYLCLGRLTCT